jgi:hypothetical protein
MFLTIYWILRDLAYPIYRKMREIINKVTINQF